VYVKVSDQYITEAIKMMGKLADVSDQEWPTQRDEFTSWCRQSMVEIEAMTKATEDEMLSHMTERVQHLRLATSIEPAH